MEPDFLFVSPFSKVLITARKDTFKIDTLGTNHLFIAGGGDLGRDSTVSGETGEGVQLSPREYRGGTT